MPTRLPERAVPPAGVADSCLGRLAGLWLLGSTAACGGANRATPSHPVEVDMKVWYAGEGPVAVELATLVASLQQPGRHHVGVVSHMPGLSIVELIDEGPDFVTIRTNEGTMRRGALRLRVETDRAVLSFDEVYEAGSMITASSHFEEQFVISDTGLRHALTISGVEAPGVVGFLYRSFGSRSIGGAVLEANRLYLESLAP